MVGMSHSHVGHADDTSLVDHGERAFEVVITVTAMMLPLVVANVRHVAFPTRRKNRNRGEGSVRTAMKCTRLTENSSRIHRGFIADSSLTVTVLP